MPTLQAQRKEVYMTDDTQQAQTPVNDTQVPAMPTETTEKTTEPVVESTAQNELPSEAPERTRNEFDKLRNQLREERERREAVEAAFSTLQPKQVQEPLYDPDTGYVNGEQLTALQKQAQQADERATRAEQTTQNFIQQQESRIAYEAHPDLNPDDKGFDKELSKKARALILDSMLNPNDYNGKSLTLKDAGDYLKGEASSQVDKARQEAATEAIEQLSPKEQAALEATGNPSRRNEVNDDLEVLRQRTRKGGDAGIEALVQRMKGVKSQ